MQDEKHSMAFEEHMRVFGREFSRTASKGFLGMEVQKAPRDNAGSTAPLSPQETTLATESNASKSTHNNKDDRTTVTRADTSLDTDSNSTTPSVAGTSATSPIATGDANCEPIVLNTEDKDFDIISPVKKKALSGAPSPSSLASKRRILPPSSKVTSSHHVQQRPHIVTSCSKPIAAKDKNHSRHDSTLATRASNLSRSSTSHSNSNPFFSGFRGTKPGLRGVSP